MWDSIVGGVGALLGLACTVLFMALFLGGISYRKDCDRDGAIVKDWTFTWFAPIPYVFRPDDPACVIHTGTSVALNSVGIATFKPTTREMIAERAAPRIPPDNAYFVRLRAVMTDYVEQAGQTETLTQAERVFRRVRSKVSALDPTPRYASLHRRLERRLADAQETGDKLRRALQSKDAGGYRTAVREAQRETRAIDSVLAEFNRLHALG